MLDTMITRVRPGNSSSAGLEKLKKILGQTGGVVVAYSGGVDSTFLLKVAYDVLGERVIAVTARSQTYPHREYLEARRLAKKMGVKHITVQTDELGISNFSNNPPDRCYHCKTELFRRLWQVAERNGIRYVVDGANLDDNLDYRPGSVAAGECHVRSPLKEAHLGKEQIRLLSRELGLSTYNKPSFACLASRFEYGEKITEGKLKVVDRLESYLRECGLSQVRVRCHNNIARIEISMDEMDRIMKNEIREEVIRKFKRAGFLYVTLDMEGYNTGSMNRVLGRKNGK
jgi:uncharacterized protein